MELVSVQPDYQESLEEPCRIAVRRILTTDTVINLMNALVVNRIDYCDAVLAGIHDVHLQQLQ